MTAGRPLAVESPLSPAQEERLAELVEELSEAPAHVAQQRLATLAAAHPDLAEPLRELFATMLVTEAVAEQSTVLDAGTLRPPAEPVAIDLATVARVFTETPGLFFERFGLAGLHAALAWVVVMPGLAWVLRRLLLPTF
ncbi:MAG: hypothetical protein EBS56_09620, partial [Planctomycetia bacterium]|nr:hypothetical protein [Planctomycetia bacterium]